MLFDGFHCFMAGADGLWRLSGGLAVVDRVIEPLLPLVLRHILIDQALIFLILPLQHLELVLLELCSFLFMQV